MKKILALVFTTFVAVSSVFAEWKWITEAYGAKYGYDDEHRYDLLIDNEAEVTAKFLSTYSGVVEFNEIRYITEEEVYKDPLLLYATIHEYTILYLPDPKHGSELFLLTFIQSYTNDDNTRTYKFRIIKKKGLNAKDDEYFSKVK